MSENKRSVKENEKNTMDIYEFEELILVMPDSKHNGFSEQDVMVKIREAQTKKGKSIKQIIITKDGKVIGKTNIHGKVEFSEEYMNSIKERDIDNQIELDRREVYLTEAEIQRQHEEEKERKMEQERSSEKKIEDKEVSEDNEKAEKTIDEDERKNMEEELEDKYTIVAEISDQVTSEEFSRLEGYVGNPYVVTDKKTGEIRIAGKDQHGNFKVSDYVRTYPSQTEVTRMNQDGTQTKEVGIKGMIKYGDSKDKALDIEITGSGSVVVNRIDNIDNPNKDEQLSITIDTKQTNPTSLEVDQMKRNVEDMDKVLEKLDELEEKGILTSQEKEDKLEQIASNGKTLDEDLEDLEKLEQIYEEKVADNEREIRGPWDPPTGY